MRVSTTQYEAAHGKSPRGKGGWAFEFKMNGHWTDPVFVRGGEFGQSLLTYSEAKREAVRRAKSAGASEVRVCS